MTNFPSESEIDSEDEALCRRSSQGDSAAEEALILRYGWLVRRCARPLFLLGADHEDLLQEGMMGMLQAIRDYDPARGAAFPTYAERCVRNRMISAVRSAAADRHAALNTSVSLEDTVRERPSYEDDPETLLLGREAFQERLKAIRSSLTPLEDRVLSLYLEGLSYGEIGARLSRGQKSIDNAIQRIRGKLRDTFC